MSSRQKEVDELKRICIDHMEEHYENFPYYLKWNLDDIMEKNASNHKVIGLIGYDADSDKIDFKTFEDDDSDYSYYMIVHSSFLYAFTTNSEEWNEIEEFLNKIISISKL